MPGTHSLLSPSSAKRWGSCTKSVPLILAANIADRSSSDADLGTRAHDFAEQVLRGTLAPELVPHDFKHVLDYVDFCNTVTHRWGGMRLVEQKVRLFYKPDDTGTVDFALLSDHGVWIIDYKNGVGEPVEATENPQLGIYGQSLIEDPDVQMLYDFRDDLPVTLVIVQPRYQGAEPIKIWETTVRGLRKFLQPWRESAHLISAAMAGDKASMDQLKLEPSYYACRWCDVKHSCTARSQAATNMVSEVLEVDVLELFDDESAPDLSLTVTPATLISDRQTLAVIQNSEFLISWIKDVQAAAHRRAAEGNPVAGTKLVMGREGNRTWQEDHGPIFFALEEAGLPKNEILENKLKSPAQIDKALKERKIKQPAALKGYVFRPPGKPKLVLDSDPRPALTADAGELFDEEPQEDNE